MKTIKLDDNLLIPLGTSVAMLKKGLKRGLLFLEDTGEVSEQMVSDFVSAPFRPFVCLENPNPSQFTSVELFAGAGGLAAGLHNAGLMSTALIEWDKHACNTLRENFKGCTIIEGDAKSVDFTNISADVVAGGFPCQAFSHAGNQQGFADIRGTLFFELMRAVKAINPKVVLGENVVGLLTHDKGRTFETMVKTLKDLGYNVKFKVLKSQFYDVPQKRERVIVIGTRSDLPDTFEFPEPNRYVTRLETALTGVPASAGVSYSAKKAKVLAMVPEGGNWRDLPVHVQKEYMGGSFELGGGKTGIARRLSLKEPSLTLTCSPSQMQTERCHPTETRPMTVREYARIQSFSDKWVFSGPITAQYKQIGNAVPVNLAYHVGTSIITYLNSI